MLDPRFLLLLLALDVWAWRASHSLLALTTTLALAIALSIRISARYCLRGVEVQRKLERERAHLGETIELSLTFVNRKLLPLTLLEIEDTLPRHVQVSGASVRRTRDELLPCLYIVRPMLPYEAVTRRVRVSCDRRGLHHFGPARWHAGDYLGVLSRHSGSADTHTLLVLPKVFPIAFDRHSSDRTIGPVAARRFLLSDPLRIVGWREYRAGDPLRSVDWRASARRGSLIVREHEASGTPALQLMIEFEVRAPAGDRVEPDELEYAISVAASIAAYALQRRFHVGLSANGLSDGAPIAVQGSSAPRQLAHILEVLARATNRPVGTLSELLARPSTQRQRGALIVVADQLDARAQALLLDMQRRGRAVLVLLTGRSQSTPALRSLPVARIPYELEWSRREKLAFVD